jgi:hypothetical protein
LWALAYRRLVYTFTDSALEIEWLGHVTGVPYTAVDGIYTGQRLVGFATPTILSWPGIYVGPGRARGIGRLRFFATSPDPAALTLITHPHGGVVVSARNPHDFRLALIERIKDSAEQPSVSTLTHQPPSSVPWSAVFDRWFAAALGLGVLLLLCIVAVIGFNFDALPADIPMRFDANGDPSQIGPRGDLLRLPLFGFVLLVADSALGIWLHARERLVARLLWLGAAVLEGVLLVALIRLLA